MYIMYVCIISPSLSIHMYMYVCVYIYIYIHIMHIYIYILCMAQFPHSFDQVDSEGVKEGR